MPEQQEQQQEQEQQQQQQDDQDELAGLDERTRRLVARANDEAAHSRARLREVETQLQQRDTELTELRQQNESEQETAMREAEERGRQAGRAERDEEVAGLARSLGTAEIVAAAGGRFADPRDAVRLLPVDDLLAEEDPAQRSRAIEQALDKLLEDKPYLAPNGASRAALVTQGPRGQDQRGERKEDRAWLRAGRK